MQYDVSGLEPGTSYFVKVQAMAVSGDMSPSGKVLAVASTYGRGEEVCMSTSSPCSAAYNMATFSSTHLLHMLTACVHSPGLCRRLESVQE